MFNRKSIFFQSTLSIRILAFHALYLSCEWSFLYAINVEACFSRQVREAKITFGFRENGAYSGHFKTSTN